ncbi:MAG: hypothetical protein CBC29_05785 [Methylococcaceae bacterium TMED69]|nr:MAG: hypothetical protein CBC29_05785 [Methylococcaceae bacterium TMED69]|tara:strand:- start:2933 stop:3664 length:732 start_codon:yes stop_codon:yes gene_type:complete
MKVKKRRKIKRPSSGRAPYFTKDTQKAIHDFCESECLKERDKLYKNEIEPALNKLAENLIFIYGFHKQHDDVPALKHSCVINLYETLHKFDHTRGKNAFSYFNVVAKNWLIIQSRKVKKHKDRMVFIDDQDSNLNTEAVLASTGNTVPEPAEEMIKKQNVETIHSMLTAMRARVKSESEIKCMDAIITIFGQVDDLDFLNKRAIFVYVRELSGLNSKQLSVCMSNIRKLYREIAGPSKEFDIL